MIDWARWPNFSEAEFLCGCNCGAALMDPEFMDRLQWLRTVFAQPMVVTSGYRCPEYNRQVSSTGADGPHTTGKAADISVIGRDAYRLLDLAFKHGFTGIGINQTGPHRGRFVHLDRLTQQDDGAPRPIVWTY